LEVREGQPGSFRFAVAIGNSVPAIDAPQQMEQWLDVNHIMLNALRGGSPFYVPRATV
jgi:hypothetical protein